MARTRSPGLLLLWPFLIQIVHGFSTFKSNCTLPDQSVNYVSAPPTRGTTDIVWSSLLALLSCTWAVQHMVVPHQIPDRLRKEDSSFKTAILFPIRRIQDLNWHKVRWMLITLAMPETVIGKAMAEYASASYWALRFGEIAPQKPALNHPSSNLTMGKRPGIAAPTGDHETQWTKTHGFFADMRGLILRFEVNAVPTSLLPQKPCKEAIEKGLHRPRNDFHMPYEMQDAREAEAIEAEMCRTICGVPCSNRANTEPSPDQASGEKQADATTTTNDALEGPSINAKGKNEEHANTLGPHKPWRGAWALSAAQWFHAYELGLIRHLPSITKEEIDDRSKGDFLVKIAAVFQILWLIISISARAYQNLEISLLEIAVLAFAATAVVTYLFFLEKPQEVRVPVYVDAAITMTRDHVISLAARSAASTIFVHEFWLHGVAVRDQAENIHPSSPGFAIQTPFRKTPFYINPILGIGLGAILFGAVHFAAWNFTFPTQVEQLLWRISCILCVALPPLGALTYYFTLYFGKLQKKNDRNMNHILKPMEYLLAPAYLLSRMYLTAEMFRQLAYLSPSAYLQVDWSAAMPHLA
ncbi:hypothetical protein FH972_024552 [Carpinus fangiana]|uniref:Uncharacterized protein n=1 Tax=Carpinus fangiana TaxID=176857 RepID=A0A5N6KYB7_9ROSI|nr:hypothetical protein FH972_024552 [Carpinus fangiana]